MERIQVNTYEYISNPMYSRTLTVAIDPPSPITPTTYPHRMPGTGDCDGAIGAKL